MKCSQEEEPAALQRQEVAGLLAKGHSEEQLTRAADGYAHHLRRHDSLAQHRQAAQNFYGDNGSFGTFRDWKPPMPKSASRSVLPRERLRFTPEKVQRMETALFSGRIAGPGNTVIVSVEGR